MYARIIPLFLVAALTVACDDTSQAPNRPDGDDLRTAPGADKQPLEAPAYGDRGLNNDGRAADGVHNDNRATPDNDNTALNERDANGNTLTPMDQSQSAPDIQISADIRKAVLSAENLSTNADNVKIITSGGVVTLRGVVNSQEEKSAVETLAKGVAGVTRVDNQLELNLQ